MGAWDESLYVEDADYWLRAAWAGCRFGHCPVSPMGFKRLRPGQKMQNPSAMERGLDEVWNKALGYINREPYRSLLAARIADWRLRRAIFKDHMDKREALEDVAFARSMSPTTISALTYAAARLLVIVPGGRYLARSQWLGTMRRNLTRLQREKQVVAP